MNSTAPLFDKSLRALFAEKLKQLLTSAETVRTISPESNREAMLVAIPRLYRRAAMVVGVFGFGIEAERIDQLLFSRRAALLQTRTGTTIDAVVDLIQLLEDVSFLVADDVKKLPPLILPAAPKAPAIPATVAKTPVKPIPTLKLPIKKSKKKRRR